MKTNHTLTSDNSPLVKSLEKENAKRRRNSENRIKSLFVVQKDNSQACLLATINNPFKELNKQQKSAQELVLAGKSIFLTGAAGTGKSFLLKHLIRLLQEKYSGEQIGITSTTGTGAIIIGGNTIHSYLGIGVIGHLPAKVLLNRIWSWPRVYENWQKVKVLIIDEISMLEGELFTKLETLAGIIRKNPEPFGGIQLILVGDFCQLPPAGKTVSRYCFEVSAWTKCINHTVNLTQVYRQKSNWLVRYLQMIRFGRLPKSCWENMLNWLGREPEWPDDGIKPLNLYSKNQEVGNLNTKELAQLPGDAYFFCRERRRKISRSVGRVSPKLFGRRETGIKSRSPSDVN